MRAKKDKVLLIFHGGHIAYSPTVLQLTDELEKNYDVTIFAYDSQIFNNKQKVPDKKIIYHGYSIKTRIRIIYEKYYYKFFIRCNRIGRQLRLFDFGCEEYFSRIRVLRKLIKKNHYKRIIAADIRNAVCCSTFNIRFDYLSLELCDDMHLFPYVNQYLIDCVIIQSEERYKYLFGDKQHIVFYIQNSPVFKEIGQSEYRCREGLLFAGTAQNQFGFYHCLRFIEKNKIEKMTVQGTIMPQAREFISENYSNLIKKGRLIISDHYLDNDEMLNYMLNFEIGFCFYNFEEDSINNFNYISAPSGKLFKYLAAGLPVICNDILGFKFVEREKCGILIPNLEEESIREAVRLIRSDYDNYVKNAIQVAKKVSFDKAIKPYIDFIN